MRVSPELRNCPNVCNGGKRTCAWKRSTLSRMHVRRKIIVLFWRRYVEQPTQYANLVDSVGKPSCGQCPLIEHQGGWILPGHTDLCPQRLKFEQTPPLLLPTLNVGQDYLPSFIPFLAAPLTA